MLLNKHESSVFNVDLHMRMFVCSAVTMDFVINSPTQSRTAPCATELQHSSCRISLYTISDDTNHQNRLELLILVTATCHPAGTKIIKGTQDIRAILRRKQVFWAPNMVRRKNMMNREGP